MALTLKDESILNEWTMIVDHGAGHGPAVMDAAEKRIQESQIPGDCTVTRDEVKSAGLFSRVRREFMIVRLPQFKDYRMYVAARDYGTHLDCCRFLTVEPGFLKKIASRHMTGDIEGLSAPRNILLHQDLRAWVTVVHHALLDSVDELVRELGQDVSKINRGSKGFLEIW